LEESTSIPYKSYDNGSDDWIFSFYSFPKPVSSIAKDYEEKKQEIINYINNVHSFNWVVDHHLNAAKWDVWPAFNICNENLHFSNVTKEECNK
jgi:hypothetical protein